VLKAHSRFFEHLTLAVDLLLIGACWLIAYFVRFYLAWPPVTLGVPPLGDYLLQLVPILGVWGLAFHGFGLYRPRRLGSRLAEWIDVAKASTLGVLVLIAIMTFVFRRYEYSRVVILYFWMLSIVATSLWRATFREGLRFARRRGLNLRRAIVVGGAAPAAEILAALRRRPDVGVQVLGVVGDKGEDVGTSAPWLGRFEELRAILDRQSAEIVFVALPHAEYWRLDAILNEIGDDPVTIHLVPDVLGLTSLRGGIEDFEGVPLIHLRESPLYGWSAVLKRAMDLVVGGLAFLLAAPLMALVALGIRLGSPGPVLLRQERMGLDGRRFSMLKLRTMRADAETATGPVWATEDDPRRTRLGAVLRRWSLDEMPQLINVLRGEMSLVGPRPERPVFVEEFRRKIPGYMLRHKVKAGMTGWAQVNGWRGSTSIEKRIEYDLYYIERWSLGFDVKILLLTLWAGFRNRNAY
jgi:Undecaprenyl-phosphate glucose phosphotransferase